MDAAMLMVVADVCGLADSFSAPAMAATRIASVTPPTLDRSGCGTHPTLPDASSGPNS